MREISHKSCCPHHTEPPATFHTVLCLVFAFHVVLILDPRCNKAAAFIAAVLREGVGDGRAPLTRGCEEAAVTLYPVNSEYIVLERGC